MKKSKAGCLNTFRMQLQRFYLPLLDALFYKPLVFYRARAMDIAKQRVYRLEQIMGEESPLPKKMLQCEHRFYMKKLQITSNRLWLSKSMIANSVLLGFAVNATGWSLLFRAAKQQTGYFASLLLRIPVILLTSLLAALVIQRLMQYFWGELLGLNDYARTMEIIKRLRLARLMLLGFAYYVLCGVVPYILPRMQTTLDNESIIFFIFIVGGSGLLLFAIGLGIFSAFASSQLTRLNTDRLLATSLPVETIAHQLLSLLLLIDANSGPGLSYSKKRLACSQLELSAYAAEHGFPAQMRIGDPTSTAMLADKMRGIANSLRSLKLWIITPRLDTFGHLFNRVLSAIESVATGELDALPSINQPVTQISILRSSMLLLAALGISAVTCLFITWLLGLMGIVKSDALPASFLALMPLASSYFIGLTLPGLSNKKPGI